MRVDPDSLFVQDGPFITGAGITAGIDLALAMVESDYGPAVARRVARWMVVFLQRPGGQAQFSVWAESALPVSGGLREIVDSVIADPGADHSLTAMAGRAAVSERHLARMFHEQVKMTPARFVEQARLGPPKCSSQPAIRARRPSPGGWASEPPTPCVGPSAETSAFHPAYTGTDFVPPGSTSNVPVCNGIRCASR